MSCAKAQFNFPSPTGSAEAIVLIMLSEPQRTTMRTFILALACATATAATAQLAPQAEAPLAAHLMEVNVQWRTMDPASLSSTPVRFRSEPERIGTHLRMVCDRLSKQAPEGLGPAQLANRNHLIGRLRAYAGAGLFPQNHALNYRNPVFIDEHNTACAVGHLMRESGNAALAQRIHDEMNLAFVHDITIADVATWGSAQGFTADELAWIQPGYPPSDPWFSLGGGTNGTVTTLLTLGNGDLLVAGDFTQAGGLNRTRVARWEGNTYQEMGNGLDGSIECAIEQAGIVLVGGSFQGGSTDIAIWNGTAWSYSNVFQGMLPSVHALHIHNGELYAAGSVSGFVGTDQRVRKLVGMAWQDVGGNMNGPILTMASFNGDLVIGGEFVGVQVFGAQDTSVMHVARLNNGGWEQLAGGLNAAVRDLEVFNGALHACGDLFENIAPVFGLARLAAGAGAWEQLMPNLTNYIFPGVGPSTIRTLHVADTTLYLGGDFSIASGLTYGNNIARFHGLPDQFEPAATLDNSVHDIAVHGNLVVIGGAFTSGNGTQLDHIGTFDLSTNVVEPPAQLEFGLAPNPARETITLTCTTNERATLTVVDATGRVVRNEPLGSNAVRSIDVSALAPGSYSVVLNDGGLSGTKTFIKQ